MIARKSSDTKVAVNLEESQRAQEDHLRMEFFGFTDETYDLFRLFTRELVLESGLYLFPREAGRIDLSKSLLEIAEETLALTRIAKESPYSPGNMPFNDFNISHKLHEDKTLRIYPRDSQEILEMTMSSGMLKKYKSFIYAGIVRGGKVSKLYSWGMRVKTKDGPRNFRWDKMALNHSGPKNVTILMKSRRRGILKRLDIWVDGYEGGMNSGKKLEYSEKLSEYILSRGGKLVFAY